MEQFDPQAANVYTENALTPRPPLPLRGEGEVSDGHPEPPSPDTGRGGRG